MRSRFRASGKAGKSPWTFIPIDPAFKFQGVTGSCFMTSGYPLDPLHIYQFPGFRIFTGGYRNRKMNFSRPEHRRPYVRWGQTG